MGLQRVSRAYLADDSGLRSLGAATTMGQVALKAAQQMAAAAASEGKGDYRASLAVVTSGWANERRLGAVVRESRHDWRDSRDAVLRTVLARMAIRTGGATADSSMVTYTRRDGTTRQATRAQAANWSRRSR